MTLKHLKIASLGLAVLAGAVLTSCNPGTLPGGTVGLPDGAGAEDASISGSVVKADGSAAENATMVLIRRANGSDSDAQIVRTDNAGTYRFTGIPAGTYRIAFVLQSQLERENGSTKYYDPTEDPQTGRYFSFITTSPFEYDGDTAVSYQVPQMDVGWVSSLSPNKEPVNVSSPINFSWGSVDGAVSYSLDVRDADNNPFYKSGAINDTNFSWSDMTGNQGTNAGKRVQAGETYYYLVTASLSRDANVEEGQPTANYGGTALAEFTAR